MGAKPIHTANLRRRYRLSARIYGFHPYEQGAAPCSGAKFNVIVTVAANGLDCKPNTLETT